MTVSQPADQILDIQDPLTYDKEFVRSIRYSPFCAGGTEISERSRKMIRSGSEGVEELYKNKFVFEIYTDKFGDFASFFLSNEDTQRALIFREFRWEGPSFEDVPEEAEALAEEQGIDLDEELDEMQSLVHVYELITGPSLEAKFDESKPAEDEPKKVVKAKVEGDELLDDKMEDMELKGDVFVVNETKTVH